MESFGESLQKLKEVYEQEVEGWQEKIFALTNQKNSDTKRIEDLFNRNQQLREQQRILTENIKQLENRLRAGLCDRCTVTQDMAKRRQQEYESSQLQSLQHISTLANEMATLRRDNKRLSEEVKSLRASLRNHNGCLAETASPEVKQLPTVASPVALPSAGQKPTASPAGGIAQKCEVGHNGLRTEESKLVDGVNQQLSFELRNCSTPPLSQPSPLTAAWNTVQNIGRHQPAPEKRTRNTEASEGSLLFPASMLLLKSNLSSSLAAPENKHESSKVHAPIPFRPQPMKTHNFPHSWHLPDNPDWVTMSVTAEGGTVVHHNPSMLRLPAIIHNTPHQTAQERVLNAQRLWAGLNPAMRESDSPQRSLSEQGEDVPNCEAVMRSRSASASAPASASACQSWKTAGTEDSVSSEGTDSNTPLDLSESGRAKAVKTPQEAPVRVTPTDSPCSSSSSSPRSSSLVESSGSQSEQRLGELIRQDEAGMGVQTEEKNETEDKTVNLLTGTEAPKVPALTISLRPVVVLENMKKSLSGHNSSDRWVTWQEKEKEEYEDEVKKEEEQGKQRKRMRLEKERETNAALQPPSLMEKRTRMGGRTKDRSPDDAEQG